MYIYILHCTYKSLISLYIFNMDKIECNFTKEGDLLPLLSLPQPTLDALVAECQIVCLLTYGTGNPDLAGVGVSTPLKIL